MDKKEPTITIKLSDIDSPEKVENFIQLFSKSNYNKVFHEFSEQRYGDGSIQAIYSEMEGLDVNKSEEDLKRFDALWTIAAKKAENLKSRKQAAVELPIYDSSRQHIFENRELAKDYLGIQRYEKATGLDGMSYANDKQLRSKNQHIKQVEDKRARLSKKLEEIENRRKEILDEQRYKSEE